MKKYNITSPGFGGEVTVLYGQEEQLLYMDFTNSDMSNEQVDYFKKHLPVTDPKDFGRAFPKSKLTVIDEAYTIGFEEFWTKYDLKRNKARVVKLWNKLSKSDQVKAYYGLNAYHRYLQLNQWRDKAEPEKYLRNRYWENEWK